MNEDLICEFRDKANVRHYCQHRYSDVEGKNLWNCICSAMDWITVGVSSIEFHPDIQLFGHSCEKTHSILMLLMQVAMIKEGVEQLHRVFTNSTDIYLNSDTTIWGGNQFSMTDNEFFETLRACFGAHPVNLKGFKGIETAERRYASWPFVGLDGFAVLLYPSSSSGSDIELDISFDQLEQYAEKRYAYLRELTNAIDAGIAELINAGSRS